MAAASSNKEELDLDFIGAGLGEEVIIADFDAETAVERFLLEEGEFTPSAVPILPDTVRGLVPVAAAFAGET